MTRIFHWVIAIIYIVLAVFSDTLMDSVSNADERIYIYNLHISFGLLFTFVLVIRFFWLLLHREERSEFDYPWQETLAHANYVILYVLMFLLVITGFTSAMAAGDDLLFFELFSIRHLDWLEDLDIKFYSRESHRYLVNVAYFFLFVHFCGAMTHYFQPQINALRQRLGI